MCVLGFGFGLVLDLVLVLVWFWFWFWVWLDLFLFVCVFSRFWFFFGVRAQNLSLVPLRVVSYSATYYLRSRFDHTVISSHV